MLYKAMEKKYAVGAFNAENLEMCQAIVAAAEKANSPVMIQTTPGTLKHADANIFRAMVQAISQSAQIPVALHLDHGVSLSSVMTAIRAGYTSIMIDGSKLPLEENISLTEWVVAACNACKIPVEGELGRVGGKEDETESSISGYTDPKEAVRFVGETGVSFLAVGVGTAHGVYSVPPALNIPLIHTLRELLPVPLVLHGGSGLEDDVVRQCIQAGIAKVNFATELRKAFTDAVRKKLVLEPGLIDPKSFCAAGREAVYELTLKKIELCGSAGKA
jgi:tagatose 1,6-diphosphate aldolase GatY/KbaY